MACCAVKSESGARAGAGMTGVEAKPRAESSAPKFAVFGGETGASAVCCETGSVFVVGFVALVVLESKAAKDLAPKNEADSRRLEEGAAVSEASKVEPGESKSPASVSSGRAA